MFKKFREVFDQVERRWSCKQPVNDVIKVLMRSKIERIEKISGIF